MTKYEAIRRIVSDLGYPEYRFGQISNAIFKQKIKRYDDMIQLPAALRDALEAELGDRVVVFTAAEHSLSKQTHKVLFRAPDGCAAEAVALEYKRGWNSFCISSQCGCACGCKFCATGGMGFKRNLTADEITDQLLAFLLDGKTLDSVSFMGMGEPLLNPEVFTALRVLTDAELFGLSQRRLTVSTVGIVAGIRRMTAEFPNVNIAFSLHAPTDDLRSEIMPVNDKFPIAEVFAALDEHIETTNRRVFLAYVMLSGVNDGDAEARALIELIGAHKRYKRLYRVDLIPYNRTSAGRFAASDRARIIRFRNILERAGLNVSVRTQFGSDINAACGQLAVNSTQGGGRRQ